MEQSQPGTPVPAAGRFGWKRRMGVHEAYHRNLANRFLHWFCIPLELWAVVKLLSLVPLVPDFQVDLALVLILVLAPIYLLTEPVIGSLMLAFLGASWYSAHHVLPSLAWPGAFLAVGLFAVTFGAQVLVGHHVFEEGRDDTEKNLREFAETKNPIPLVLVFYYHLVEIVLNVGYRPALRKDIAVFTTTEIRSWE